MNILSAILKCAEEDNICISWVGSEDNYGNLWINKDRNDNWIADTEGMGIEDEDFIKKVFDKLAEDIEVIK